MRRPFYVQPLEKREGPFHFQPWWDSADELAKLTDDEIHKRSISDHHQEPENDPPEIERFLAEAVALGVNVGALWRALYAQWIDHAGHTSGFDACTWGQALGYASNALPTGTEAERYEWAIRYMWCLELPEPVTEVLP